MAAATKYPWEFEQAEAYLGANYKPRLEKYYRKKWGFYSDDANLWQPIQEKAVDPGRARSINADIMDLADDVTYAVHDVHDYFRVGLIPLHLIGEGLRRARDNDEFTFFDAYAIASLQSKPEIEFTAEDMLAAKKWLRNLPIPRRPYSDFERDREALHAFESAAVRRVQEAVKLDAGLFIPNHIILALEYLKELTWYYVINHPSLSSSQQGQRRVIQDLHEWLCTWAKECYPHESQGRSQKVERNLRRLPARFSDMLRVVSLESDRDEDAKISRAAVDFIVGLTDVEAATLHAQLGGSSLYRA